MKRSHLALFCALLGPALGGCFHTFSPPPSATLEATDRGVSLPTVRISWGEPVLTDVRERPSEPQVGFGRELNLSATRGSASQTLGAGQLPIRFGDTTFSAPQSLKHEFDFSFFDISGRFRVSPSASGPVDFELLGGLGYAEFDLTVSSPAQRATDKLEFFGPTFGAGLIWRLRPGTGLHARITLLVPFSSDQKVSRWEVFLVQALGRSAAVRAGYAAWKAERDFDDRSDIRLRFSGPSLGLDLNF